MTIRATLAQRKPRSQNRDLGHPGLLLDGEEDLEAYVGDPAGLAVGLGYGLVAAAGHEEKVVGFGLVEGLAAT